MSLQCRRLGPMGSLTGLWGTRRGHSRFKQKHLVGHQQERLSEERQPPPHHSEQTGQSTVQPCSQGSAVPYTAGLCPDPPGAHKPWAEGGQRLCLSSEAKGSQAEWNLPGNHPSRGLEALFCPSGLRTSSGTVAPHPGVHGQMGICDRHSDHPVPSWAGGSTTHGVRARTDGSAAVPSRVRQGWAVTRC